MKRCATCYNDPITKSWHNPDNVKLGGTSESNWVCPRCVRRQPNRGWAQTPTEEVYGIEAEHEGDSHPLPDYEPGPFETPLCIEIMKRYVLGQSYRAIAAALQTDRKDVYVVIKYWRDNRGYFIEELKSMLARIC